MLVVQYCDLFGFCWILQSACLSYVCFIISQGGTLALEPVRRVGRQACMQAGRQTVRQAGVQAEKQVRR